MRAEADILVVGDSAEDLLLLNQFFTRHGRYIRMATSGEDAIGILEQSPFSLLVTGLDLPGMNGFELAELAKTIHPSIRIFMIAPLTPVERRALARKAGVQGVLEKPINVDVLPGELGLEA